MSKVLELAITKVDVERRQHARDVLTEAMADEHLDCIFMVRIRDDGTWKHDFAGHGKLTEMLGKVEVAKCEQIAQYLRDG